MERGQKTVLSFIASWLEELGLNQHRCMHCLRPFLRRDCVAASDTLCRECVNSLPMYEGIRCAICGIPASVEANVALSNVTAIICENCKKERPQWDKISYYGIYEGPLRDLILRFKFDAEMYLSRLFSDFLLEASVCLPRPDIIIPIPQYHAHLRKRGYNQSYELCKTLAKASGLKTSASILKRIRDTPPQEGLNASQRRVNLRKAFWASSKARGAVFWLVDDVMTTGSTFNEACHALRSAGAKNIYALCIARTPLF